MRLFFHKPSRDGEDDSCGRARAAVAAASVGASYENRGRPGAEAAHAHPCNALRPNDVWQPMRAGTMAHMSLQRKLATTSCIADQDVHRRWAAVDPRARQQDGN